MSYQNNVKARLTHQLVKSVESLQKNGKVTPASYWIDILNDEDPTMFELTPKDRASVKLKASEILAKYVYDQTLETQEVDTLIKSKEDIDAIKASLIQWANK